MKMTDAERKRAQRERQRREGLVPLEVWVKPQDKDKVKRYVKKLKK